jgi:hypothetical protein
MSDAARLLEGLRLQEERYRAVAGAVGEQKRAVAASDVDALLAAAGRQRELLAEIEALDADLAPLRRRWAELRAAAEPPLARALEEAVDRVREVLGTLVQATAEAKSAVSSGPPPQARARAAYGA